MSEFKVRDKVRLKGGVDEWVIVDIDNSEVHAYPAFGDIGTESVFIKENLELISRAPTLVKHWPAIYSTEVESGFYISDSVHSEGFSGTKGFIRLATEYPPILLPKGE